jgi:DNA invertase Pin-like site-specific DNA recombinase
MYLTTNTVIRKEVIHMTVYGYARVSTKDQNLARQIKALNEAGCEHIFRDKLTGTNTDRPQLQEMLETIQEGDMVIVLDLTRVSRSTQDLLAIVNQIGDKGADFKSLKESWVDTTSPHGKFMLTMFSGLAELERDLIVQRTREGMAIAKEKGKAIGRPSKDKENVNYAIEMWKEGKHNIKDICKITGVGKSTLYRKLKEAGLK